MTSLMYDEELSSIHSAAQPRPEAHFQPVDVAGPRSMVCRTPWIAQHEVDLAAEWEPEDPYDSDEDCTDDEWNLRMGPSHADWTDEEWNLRMGTPCTKKRERPETPLLPDAVLSADECLAKRMRMAYQQGDVVDLSAETAFYV